MTTYTTTIEGNDAVLNCVGSYHEKDMTHNVRTKGGSKPPATYCQTR